MVVAIKMIQRVMWKMKNVWMKKKYDVIEKNNDVKSVTGIDKCV